MPKPPIKKDAIKQYLDSCIVKWKKFNSCPENSEGIRNRAKCYIDVYQDIRTKLFGKTLK